MWSISARWRPLFEYQIHRCWFGRWYQVPAILIGCCIDLRLTNYFISKSCMRPRTSCFNYCYYTFCISCCWLTRTPPHVTNLPVELTQELVYQHVNNFNNSLSPRLRVQVASRITRPILVTSGFARHPPRPEGIKTAIIRWAGLFSLATAPRWQ